MTELLVIATAIAGVAVARELDDRQTPRTSFRLTFPRMVKEDQVTAAFRALAGLLPPWPQRLISTPTVVLEAIGTANGIAHILTLPTARVDQIVGALRAAVPGVRISENGFTLPPTALARELRVAGAGQLRTDASAASNSGLLAALQPVDCDEATRTQLVIAPVAEPVLPRLGDLVGLFRSGEVTQRRDRPEPDLAVGVRLAVSAGEPRRARLLMARLIGAVHAVGTPEARLRRRFLPSAWVAGRVRRAARPDWGAVRLGANELASVAGVPVAGPDLPGLTLAGSKELPVASAVRREGLVLGDSTVAGSNRPVAVELDEVRRGLHLCSPTGGGKSTVLLNLATQLVAADRGVILIDSKGDLAADLCERVPENRVDDVVMFDPADPAPMGFNLIGGSGEAELVVDHVVGQFRSRYGAAGLGPRSEDVLRASLLTLARQPGYTLCEVEPLLVHAAFRQRLLGRLDEPVLERFWAWYGGLSDAARAEVIGPLANKIRSYTLRRRVRTVIGQADGLDFGDVLANGRVLIVSLARGLVGKDASALIGAAMVSRLWTAIQARAGTRASARRPAVVICDEFADFASLGLSFADAIAQSRGYGVGWVLAHQHLGQLDRATRQAVLANCRTRLVMQTTADDAATLAREFAPQLEAADLQGLGPFEGYAAVSTGAAVAPAASVRTRPAPPSLGTGQRVREASRKRHGHTPAEVDEAIRARLESGRPMAPVGGVRRAP